MFTGIVEKVRVVRRRSTDRLVLDIGSAARATKIGSSLAVNGVCLTVVERLGSSVAFDLSEETLTRTTLGFLQPGQWVNLERPVKVGQEIGGHIVQGHVDSIGCVLELRIHSRGATMRIAAPKEIRRWLVPRGSVALDGVSLTVSHLGRSSKRDTSLLRYYNHVLIEESKERKPPFSLLQMLDWFTVNLISHTMKESILGDKREGDLVNIEADVLLKWLAEMKRYG